MADKPNTGEDPKPGAPSGIPPTKPAFKQVVPPHIPVNHHITGGLLKLLPEDQEKKRKLEEAAEKQERINKNRQKRIDEGKPVSATRYPQNVHVRAFYDLFKDWSPSKGPKSRLPAPSSPRMAAPANASSQAMPLAQTLSGAGPAPAQKKPKLGNPRIALAGSSSHRQTQSIQFAAVAAGPPQASPAAAGPPQASPAAAGPPQASPASTGPPQARPAAAGPPQASPAAPFPAHVGPAKFTPQLPRKWAEAQIYAGGGGAGPGYVPGAVLQPAKKDDGGSGLIFAPGAVLYPSKKGDGGAGPGYAPGAGPQPDKKGEAAGDGGSGSSTISPTTRYQWSNIVFTPRNSIEFEASLARLKKMMEDEKSDREKLEKQREERANKHIQDLLSRVQNASGNSSDDLLLLKEFEAIFHKRFCGLMDIFDSEKTIDEIKNTIRLWYDKRHDPHFRNKYVDRSAEVAYNTFNERYASSFQK